ncbi:unnamed protein product [Rhizopus microsporus]|uniref:Nudix hydrolase domain-containing protein n=1 Tax=Rhizopus microsporus TaxID=58291 RepID=A0A1X0RS51_RHIZD|nr:hypothetical protein BCV71DRAFT_220334 [Rhizopus microsporus]
MSKQDLKNIIDRLDHFERNRQPTTPISDVRHACVAAIIRWRPFVDHNSNHDPVPSTVSEFFNEPWVNDCHGQAELLYIQRAVRPDDPWSGQVGFPGGKSEPSDKDDLHTVIRECKEEIGLDLGSSAFIHLATLDPRAIKKYDDDNKVVMILVPHVFLQVTPQTPPLSVPNSEIAEAIWVPLRYLLSNPIIPFDAITTVNEKIKKLWPSSVLVPAIALKQTTDGPHLWGMTLRMTQEVVGLPLSKNAIVTTLTAEEIEKYKGKSKM